MQGAYPLPHSGQPETTAFADQGIEANAIVHHSEGNRSSIVVQIDPQAPRVTMSQSIGNRFLRYTIESVLDEEWEPALCPIHAKIHVDGTAFGHPLDRVFERILKVRRFA